MKTILMELYEKCTKIGHSFILHHMATSESKIYSKGKQSNNVQIFIISLNEFYLYSCIQN